MSKSVMWEPDIEKANRLIADLRSAAGQWQTCAKRVAEHCLHRQKGQCLIHCWGAMVCDTLGLDLIGFCAKCERRIWLRDDLYYDLPNPHDGILCGECAIWAEEGL